MKPTTLLALSFVFVSIGTAAALAADEERSIPRQEKLLTARNAWYAAFCRGDTTEMDRIEARDFLVLSESGVETKDQQLRGIRRRVEQNNWLPKDTVHVTEDLKVRFYGGSAVVTGRGWMKFPAREDQPQKQSALTEVWVERDGQWSVVHLHFHQIARP
jgi:hypothetical protein